METVISVTKPKHKVVIEKDKDNLDGLNFLAGKRISEVNRMAEMGTLLAHFDGGVPNIRIEIPEINEYYIGGLLYFFEKACGISGYALGVNPFDQPGVEAYKKNSSRCWANPVTKRPAKSCANGCKHWACQNSGHLPERTEKLDGRPRPAFSYRRK